MSQLAVIPGNPWAGRPLTPAALEVLRAYTKYADDYAPRDGLPFPSSRNLRAAYAPHLSRKTWARAVRQLIDLDLVAPTPEFVRVTVPTNLLDSRS